MSYEPIALDHTFTAPIGVDVKGDVWPCVEMPDSAAFFGTGRSVRVDLTIDGLPVSNVGMMVTGTGGHMVSLNAGLRRRLAKGVGDSVTIHLIRRVK